jgi:copper(I)-binding protein
MRIKALRFIVAVFVTFLAIGFGTVAADEIRVEDAWARASIGTKRPGVIYLTIHNMSSVGDRLLGAVTEAASKAIVHESIMTDGVMRMRPAGGLDIPPNNMVRLEPGGLHLMLTNLKMELVEGESFSLTLTFERAFRVTVDVAIAGLSAIRAPHDNQE